MQKTSESPPFPVVRRARGYRLYDRRGRRFLDLSLAGGRAILGHRPGRLVGELKNVLEKGLLYPMPNLYMSRLVKELKRRYPEFAGIAIASSLTEARGEIARYLRCECSDLSVADPALGEKGPLIWDRPLLPESLRRTALAGAKVALPVTPFAMPGLQPICFREVGNTIEAPPPLSPMLVAGTLRSLYDLDRFAPPEWFRKDVLAHCKCWEQRGPYIKPVFPKELYPEVFARFLHEAVILAPHPGVPSVLPGEASAGELAKLMRLFEEDV